MWPIHLASIHITAFCKTFLQTSVPLFSLFAVSLTNQNPLVRVPVSLTKQNPLVGLLVTFRAHFYAPQFPKVTVLQDFPSFLEVVFAIPALGGHPAIICAHSTVPAMVLSRFATPNCPKKEGRWK